MPGNVAAAAPSTVMPAFLSSQFELMSSFECDLNYYADGSGQASAIVTTSRKTWRAQVPCDSALLASLRSFWIARKKVEPFYFYFWRETVPLGQVDLTGASTVGRYACKFLSDWSEEFTLGRTTVQVEITESL